MTSKSDVVRLLPYSAKAVPPITPYSRIPNAFCVAFKNSVLICCVIALSVRRGFFERCVVLEDDDLVVFNGIEAGLGAVDLLAPCFEHKEPISDNIRRIRYRKVIQQNTRTQGKANRNQYGRRESMEGSSQELRGTQQVIQIQAWRGIYKPSPLGPINHPQSIFSFPFCILVSTDSEVALV